MISLKLFLIFICAILFSSCATVYTGNKGVIHFSSEPQNAIVLINGKKIGTTPLTIKVKRTLNKRTVTIKKEGYESSTFKLEKKLVPISILSNSMIPIDALSGAIVKYKKQFYNVPLKIKSNNQDSKYRYNLNDNYYVITLGDTLFTDPTLTQEHKKFFGLIEGDKMDVKLINGEIKSLPLIDIIKYKTLEISRNVIGLLFLSLQTNTGFYTGKYINTLFAQKNDKSFHMFMEDLIDSSSFHLVRVHADATKFHSNIGLAELTPKAIYYIYDDGHYVAKLEEDNLLKTIELRFNNQQKLIALLKKKNKFKVLEKYFSDKMKASNMKS